MANDDDQVASGMEGAHATGLADQQEGIGPSCNNNAHGLGGKLSNGFPPPQGPTTSAYHALLKDGIARQGGKEGEGLVSGQEMH